MNIYDFDGTLYSGDSTVDFLKYSFRKHPGLIRFLPAMGIAALRHYGFKSIDKTAMKQVFYSMFTAYDAEALLEEFWDLHEQNLFPWYQASSRKRMTSSSPPLLNSCCVPSATGWASNT